jgi:hypothetical protein
MFKKGDIVKYKNKIDIVADIVLANSMEGLHSNLLRDHIYLKKYRFSVQPSELELLSNRKSLHMGEPKKISMKKYLKKLNKKKNKHNSVITKNKLRILNEDNLLFSGKKYSFNKEKKKELYLFIESFKSDIYFRKDDLNGCKIVRFYAFRKVIDGIEGIELITEIKFFGPQKGRKKYFPTNWRPIVS